MAPLLLTDDRTRCRVPVTAKSARSAKAEIDLQMAAPTFVTNLIMHRAAMAHTECEWKRGKGSAQRLTFSTGSKATATAVLTNGLLMEALSRLYRPSKRRICRQRKEPKTAEMQMI